MTAPTLDELLAQAHHVGELAAQHAPSTERERRLAAPAADALLESGLIKILQPTRYGGYELGFGELVRVGQAIAHHDVSAAWVFCILGIHHWWGAFVSPQLQDELWGDDPETCFVDSFAPNGKAEPVDGGMRLSGKWGFLSGLPWARWAAVGAIAPAAPGAEPEYLMFFVPQSDYTVVDDWHTVGLRGSASASVQVDNVFVPTHRVFRMGHAMATGEIPGHAVNPGPLYRVSLVGGLGLALVPPSLGGAQALLRRFQERATARVPLFSAQRQAELVLSQSTLAETAVELDMAEGLMYRYADEVTARGASGEAFDTTDRTRLYAWRAVIARRAREANFRLTELAGASAIFENEPLQRYWRDVHAMGQHVALNYESAVRNYGRSLLGLTPDAVLY